eukprot:CAMPEP_0176153326 /NCGR_PEP_ID=MMETSP0120_2-20121206/78319_1 /TAXON_ID=160619 /ORGANISM="Kryptoperidinium foliaceum, Strain CCMP 1326" /LENGTH=39 /DNA_ID= /DNA_START= /DNA_END= /DNA_ORIENTATION=
MGLSGSHEEGGATGALPAAAKGETTDAPAPAPAPEAPMA